MHTVVLDTNVLISGIIAASGPSALILDALRQGEIALVTSPALLQEFNEVIVRPYFAQKYPEVIRHAEAILDFIRANATLVEGVPGALRVSEDPDDDFVLACALEGQADYIISGDQHLMALVQHEGVPIPNPRQFVDTVLASTGKE